MVPDSVPPYAELHCVSNFSFLRGASHPEELMRTAAELGYRALAITDEASLAGVVRAHTAARAAGIKLIIGTEIRLEDGPTLVLLAPSRRAYGQLAALISLGRSLAAKGAYRLTRADLNDAVPDCLAIMPLTAALADEQADWFADNFPDRGWLGLSLLRDGADAARRRRSRALQERTGLAEVACGDIHMHCRGRRALQDTLVAIRNGVAISRTTASLHGNGERHLRPRQRLGQLYPAMALRESLRIADQCRFTLDELRYEYPEELVPADHTPTSWLRRLTELGAAERWPEGPPDSIREQIERELALIAELGYEPYFLTVRDIVVFARDRGILCQGRGSAANSVVCFCLMITDVNPATMELLFERFVSRERNEPPDIDVDFEHERREEVIQYVYRKYGRHRAALAASVICYRPRSALRDVARAMGLPTDQVDRLAKAVHGWDGDCVDAERLREAGFDPDGPVIHRLLTLTNELIGFPRHLSQHVGGFVISQGPLAELVATENAAMAGRSIIQWDKDDLEAIGLLKVDCLALGMLTAIHRCFDLVRGYRGRDLSLASVPADDDGVYAMISRADTVGVFQIESRAQMAMLPRMRPRCFYDLVIEISIVRPGPIQGDMVHPYLRRRNGEEPVTYPSEAVRGVLARTLGVPIFQEQVMKLAVVAAGFTPGEADDLRRAMAAWRRRGGLGPHRDRLIRGMKNNGYPDEFAERIFEQIQGFGEYGFPESHAASFALLVYVSAWLKHHEPAAFTAALLNSQPMGFYGPDQLVRDARRHGVTVRPVDVNASDSDCTLEPNDEEGPALRLGLRLINGLGIEAATRIAQARAERPFRDTQDLAVRAGLSRAELKPLAEADALANLSGHRRNAWWSVLGVETELPLFPAGANRGEAPLLAPPSEGEALVHDYQSTGLSLRRHPVALLRERLGQQRYRRASELRQMGHQPLVRAAGIVITRQRPASGGGVLFVTLEDETGVVNVIIRQSLAERERATVVGASLMGVIGSWEARDGVHHLVAGRVADHSDLLGELIPRSRDFH
jgi:error-prone DNA polymerase